MRKETQLAIDAICEALDADPDAGPALRAAIDVGMGINLAAALERRESVTELIEIQRSVGYVDALAEVIKKLAGVAHRLRQQDDQATAELFEKFSEKLLSIAEKKKEPITRAADRIRASRSNAPGGIS